MTIKLLRQAREALANHNISLKQTADSGDCGFWLAEEQEVFIEAEKAIAAIDDFFAKKGVKNVA